MEEWKVFPTKLYISFAKKFSKHYTFNILIHDNVASICSSKHTHKHTHTNTQTHTQMQTHTHTNTHTHALIYHHHLPKTNSVYGNFTADFLD